MMKPLLYILFASSLLGGCTSNYFSNYETVYRIETTGGERYYSESKPDLNNNGYYEIEDLDGNDYQIKKELIYKVEKYKHRK